MNKKQLVEQIIEQLKSIEVDGETMEFIIESVGMSNQMCRQLVMNCDESELNYLIEDKEYVKSITG